MAKNFISQNGIHLFVLDVTITVRGLFSAFPTVFSVSSWGIILKLLLTKMTRSLQDKDELTKEVIFGEAYGNYMVLVKDVPWSGTSKIIKAIKVQVVTEIINNSQQSSHQVNVSDNVFHW